MAASATGTLRAGPSSRSRTCPSSSRTRPTAPCTRRTAPSGASTGGPSARSAWPRTASTSTSTSACRPGWTPRSMPSSCCTTSPKSTPRPDRRKPRRASPCTPIGGRAPPLPAARREGRRPRSYNTTTLLTWSPRPGTTPSPAQPSPAAPLQRRAGASNGERARAGGKSNPPPTCNGSPPAWPPNGCEKGSPATRRRPKRRAFRHRRRSRVEAPAPPPGVRRRPRSSRRWRWRWRLLASCAVTLLGCQASRASKLSAAAAGTAAPGARWRRRSQRESNGSNGSSGGGGGDGDGDGTRVASRRACRQLAPPSPRLHARTRKWGGRERGGGVTAAAARRFVTAHGARRGAARAGRLRAARRTFVPQLRPRCVRNGLLASAGPSCAQRRPRLTPLPATTAESCQRA
eukprot:scaffold827_cov369-Prasinococcus_capsulatus_cf.AAC.25